MRSRPNGLPIATTGSPTETEVDEPSASGRSASDDSVTFSSAVSVESSLPTTLAWTRSSFENETNTGPAPSTTCALVRMWPSLSITKPEPWPWACVTRTTPGAASR